MKARFYARIAEVDPARWDAVGSQEGNGGDRAGDPFSTYAVLAALGDATLPGVRLSYLTLEDAAGGWIAAAPLCRVEIDGGRLSRGPLRRMIAVTRRLYPGFLRTAAMICGTPLSVGNPPARIAAEADRRAVLRELAGLLEEVADEQGAPWRGFKEFPEGDLADARAVLEAGGWVVAPSEPNFRIALPWADYEGYLASLRSDYRYKIRKAARKMAEAGIAVEVLPLRDGYDPAAHALYDAVVARAAAQLERLTPEFFVAFGRIHGENAPMIRLRRNGRVVGWVAMLFTAGTAFDMFHGIDYDANAQGDLYFNQLAETIRLSIHRGARVLSMGQSTEVAKTRFGGRLVPLWAVFRHRNPAIQGLLRAGRRQLFPAKSAPVRHVFHQTPEAP